MRGLDADSCRAVATAVLGDPNKVTFVALTTINRFTALQSGEVDILIRSTTWTLGREAKSRAYGRMGERLRRHRLHGEEAL